MDESHESEETLKLALTVSPRRVSVVRRFVEEVAERLGANADLSARVALTAHELLENVAKYGHGRQGILRVELTPGQGQRRLVVTVSNETSPVHIDRLKQVFRDMDDGPDPFIHYFTLMRRDVEEGESGLGLARIRAEGEMLLSLTIRQNEVSIVATSEFYLPVEENT